MKTKRTTTYDVENTSPYLGQTQTCGGVNPVNDFPIFSPLVNWT